MNVNDNNEAYSVFPYTLGDSKAWIQSLTTETAASASSHTVKLIASQPRPRKQFNPKQSP